MHKSISGSSEIILTNNNFAGQISEQLNHKINYQRIDEEFYQKERCCALAFNKEQTLVAAGCGRQIRIMSFLQGNLTTTQIIDSHKSDVVSLQFLKKSNYLISGGGDDRSIMIWSQDNQQKWLCSQFIKKAHYSNISQIILNDNEDLLISCGGDPNIKFWKKPIDWQCEQIIQSQSEILLDISLNESQNQLVSCGENDYSMILQIFYESENQIWRKKQIIIIKDVGVRITFLGGDVILFQPFNQVIYSLFKLNKESKLFERKNRDIYYDKSFGCSTQRYIYNKRKQILISGHGCTIEILDVENFTILQTIDQKTPQYCCAISDDGEYMIMWDYHSKKFQVFQNQ